MVPKKVSVITFIWIKLNWNEPSAGSSNWQMSFFKHRLLKILLVQHTSPGIRSGESETVLNAILQQQILLCRERYLNVPAKSRKFEWADNCWVLLGCSLYFHWLVPFQHSSAKRRVSHSVRLYLGDSHGLRSATLSATLGFFPRDYICSSCWSRITPDVGIHPLRCPVKAICAIDYLKRAVWGFLDQRQAMAN